MCPEGDLLARGLTHEDDDERGRHAGLREDGAVGGAGDAPAEPVDEEQVERDVRREAQSARRERGAGVLEPAQDTGGREDDEHRRDADGRDPQVGHGVAERLG